MEKVDEHSIYTDLKRGGVFSPDSMLSDPYYLPQYDTTWCPIDFFNDFNNAPNMGADKDSKLSYVFKYDHEFRHKWINYRTIVGFIHMTFAMRKVSELFYWFPLMKNRNETLNRLLFIEKAAQIFLKSTQVWDETFALFQTCLMAKTVGISSSDIRQYELIALETYPNIKEPYSIIKNIFNDLKNSDRDKIYFINAIFNDCASIDPSEVLEFNPNEEKTLPLSSHVDNRFLTTLRFCDNYLKNNSNVTLAKFASEILKYNKDNGISNEISYNRDDFEEICYDLEDRYIDGFFKLMYIVIWKQLMRDMEIYRDEKSKLSDFPISAITIRPDNSNHEKLQIMRESFLVNDELIELATGETISLNIASCFINFFFMGQTVNSVLKGKYSAICNSEFSNPMCICGSSSNCYMQKTIDAMNNKIDPESLGEAFYTSIRFYGGIK